MMVCLAFHEGPQIQAPLPGGGKMVIRGPYSNIETIAVNLETVSLEAVDLEVVRLEGLQRLSGCKTASC